MQALELEQNHFDEVHNGGVMQIWRKESSGESDRGTHWKKTYTLSGVSGQ